MPACMIPLECPSSSPVPPSDCSSASSPCEAEGPALPSETEERVSPHPWMDSKRGEVKNAASFPFAVLYFMINFQYPIMFNSFPPFFFFPFHETIIQMSKKKNKKNPNKTVHALHFKCSFCHMLLCGLGDHI